MIFNFIQNGVLLLFGWLFQKLVKTRKLTSSDIIGLPLALPLPLITPHRKWAIPEKFLDLSLYGKVTR